MSLRATLAALAATALLLASCGGGDGGGGQTTVDDLVAGGYEEIAAAASGTTVRWWLFGGDEAINSYLDDVVAPAAAALGVTLERVPIDDTADAVQRVISEVDAGSEGQIDLIWINGENFRTGVESGLWSEGWATELPNAQLIDAETVATDFGTPVEGRESPWSRAAFIFAHDPETVPNPPTNFQELLDYAVANPGRITYPAPPDFTGSAFVRLAVQALGEDKAFTLLEELRPVQFRDGESFPASEAELSELFGNGEVDIAMSYNPGFVAAGVRTGTFADTTRPYVFDTGTLQNTSYVVLPVTAPNPAGAMVLANLLLDPMLQAAKADPDVLGVPSVLDLDRLEAADRKLFDALGDDNPYTLTEFGDFIEELGADRVSAIESRWLEEIRG